MARVVADEVTRGAASYRFYMYSVLRSIYLLALLFLRINIFNSPVKTIMICQFEKRRGTAEIMSFPKRHRWRKVWEFMARLPLHPSSKHTYVRTEINFFHGGFDSAGRDI